MSALTWWKDICVHCKAEVDKHQDFCFGCKQLVCKSCIVTYDHILAGAHGKKEE